MNKLRYILGLQWRIDARDKDVLLVYYIIPILFFLVMGSVFNTIDPERGNTLGSAMMVFSVSMGAIIGTPIIVGRGCSIEILKSYLVGGIRLWQILLAQFVSGLIHLSTVAAIIYFGARLLYGSNFDISIIAYTVIALAFISVSVLIGVTIGLYFSGHSMMTFASQLIFLPSLMLSGVMFPRTLLPSFLNKVGAVLPATNAFVGMVEADKLLISLIWILSIGVLLIIISGFRYNKIHKHLI